MQAQPAETVRSVWPGLRAAHAAAHGGWSAASAVTAASFASMRLAGERSTVRFLCSSG
jgi:acyl-coenzyme A thioesterase PaaI-like protein